MSARPVGDDGDQLQEEDAEETESTDDETRERRRLLHEVTVSDGRYELNLQSLSITNTTLTNCTSKGA